MLVPATEAMAEVKLAHDMTAFREAAAEAVAEVEVALMHGVIAIAVTHAVAEVQLAQEVPTFRVAMAERADHAAPQAVACAGPRSRAQTQNSETRRWGLLFRKRQCNRVSNTSRPLPENARGDQGIRGNSY